MLYFGDGMEIRKLPIPGRDYPIQLASEFHHTPLIIWTPVVTAVPSRVISPIYWKEPRCLSDGLPVE